MTALVRNKANYLSPRKRGLFYPGLINACVLLLVMGIPGLQAQAARKLTNTDWLRLNALYHSYEHGLEPSDYDIATLESLLQDDGRITRLDIASVLDRAFDAYRHDLSRGRLTPALADPDWHIPSPANASLTGLDVDELAPPHADYRRLRTVLAEYRAIQDRGGWPAIPDGPVLALGVRHPSVALLRERLGMTGDYSADTQVDPNLFDKDLDQALRHFQRRHGLKDDGVVYARIREALNVPVEQKIQQILIALERWRWLPRELGGRYIWINIAGAELQVIEQDQPVLTMKTIVGRSYRSTPSFSSKLKSIVANPTWTVPHTVATEDLLPLQQQDIHFLDRKQIRVFRHSGDALIEIDPARVDWSKLSKNNFPYTLRQDAGSNNSLGQVKFQFDNPFDIYMHDTPAKLLFDLPVRTFSSGCVRLEKPRVLANYLLYHDPAGRGWNIEQAIAQQQTRVLTLNRALPIYLVYLTAWVSADGVAHFREDAYGRDAAVWTAWNRAFDDRPARFAEAR